MRFLIASTLLSLATAAPFLNAMEADDAALEPRGQVNCTIMGTEGTSQASTAPAGGITADSPTGYLAITCSNGIKWDSGRSLPISQTVKAKDTGLAEDVHWTQSWETGGYKSCSMTYGDGNPTVQGTVNSDQISIAIGAGSSLSDTCGAPFFV